MDAILTEIAEMKPTLEVSVADDRHTLDSARNQQIKFSNMLVVVEHEYKARELKAAQMKADAAMVALLAEEHSESEPATGTRKHGKSRRRAARG